MEPADPDFYYHSSPLLQSCHVHQRHHFGHQQHKQYLSRAPIRGGSTTTPVGGGPKRPHLSCSEPCGMEQLTLGIASVPQGTKQFIGLNGERACLARQAEGNQQQQQHLHHLQYNQKQLRGQTDYAPQVCQLKSHYFSADVDSRLNHLTVKREGRFQEILARHEGRLGNGSSNHSIFIAKNKKNRHELEEISSDLKDYQREYFSLPCYDSNFNFKIVYNNSNYSSNSMQILSPDSNHSLKNEFL